MQTPLVRVAVALAALIAASSPALAQGDKAFGEYLSSECVTCHQLTGRYEGIPPIVGWPEASFVAAMNAYRAKERPNPVMQTIAGRLSREEVAALATYFASVQVGTKK
jgi:cytochrome c553